MELRHLEHGLQSWRLRPQEKKNVLLGSTEYGHSGHAGVILVSVTQRPVLTEFRRMQQ